VMITAVDTNILLDVLIPEAPFGAASQQSLDTALQHGIGGTTARIFRNFACWRACKVRSARSAMSCQVPCRRWQFPPRCTIR
jgi:hypothetical protein